MGNFKPYFIAENETGIASDIITAAFKHLPQYNVTYRYGIKVKAAWTMFEKGKVDAIANLFDNVDMKGCRSDPVIQFYDVAISLKKNNFKIEKIADLHGKNVIAFQGARIFFGEEYAKNVNKRNYREFTQQEHQAYMLDAERTEVSVGDLFIFLQGLREIKTPRHKPSDFVIHRIFPQISTRIAFHDKTICQDFNKALKIIKNSGEYDAIYKRYMNQLGYNM